MKRILLAALILFTSNAFAQTWVQVPALNFQNYIASHYPSNAYMSDGSGFYVDSDHPAILATDSLNLSYMNFSNLEGLQAFQNLQYLNCSYNSLTSLPQLSPVLRYLGCIHNNLSTIPALPATLKYLDCYNNELSELPELSPILKRLLCDSNFVTSLPELPNTMEELACQANLLTALPDLPASLTSLVCSSNQLSELPALPDGLITLACPYNNLSVLPALSSALVDLNCHNNQLVTLPQLPIGLINLTCEYNQLTELNIPLNSSLQMIVCYHNQITCINQFPSTLSYVSLSENPITCVPSYVSGSPWLQTYPLCDLNDPVNNPNNCPTQSGIVGSVFHDLNSDCIPSTEMLDNIPVAVYDLSNNLVSSTVSFGNGQYYFTVDAGDYLVKVQDDVLPNAVSVLCPSNNQTNTEVLVASNGLASGGDFGLACAGFDLGVQSVLPTGWIFPGQTHELNIQAGDLTAQYNMHCATGISGDVTIAVSGPGSVTFGGSPTSVSGNTATYTLADFGALGANLFSASVLTDTTANSGDQFCVSVTVTTASSGDLNPANNTYNFCYQIVNSYDPNIKLTTPELVDPGYEDEFTYTIYFQNTGNAPAFNIRLADTLDQNLDLSTLKFVNGSHAFTTSLNADSRLLNIRFPNIMLPDSTADAEGSIGFIQYRAKPVSGLPNGTIIRNTAYIYFDFNAPIVTNTSENRFSSVGLNELTETIIKVYPNPASGVVTFESDERIEQLEFYDLNGTKVKAVQPNTGKTQIDISSFENGVYLVKVHLESGVVNKRLVVSY